MDKLDREALHSDYQGEDDLDREALNWKEPLLTCGDCRLIQDCNIREMSNPACERIVEWNECLVCGQLNEQVEKDHNNGKCFNCNTPL